MASLPRKRGEVAATSAPPAYAGGSRYMRCLCLSVHPMGGPAPASVVAAPVCRAEGATAEVAVADSRAGELVEKLQPLSTQHEIRQAVQGRARQQSQSQGHRSWLQGPPREPQGRVR